ncbi:MAG: serine acetyltransferase [Bacteroidaceae bacterium]|nr:serine acetyltransferase [Bacteroidaceae bacterium]
MPTNKNAATVSEAVRQLSAPDALQGLFHPRRPGEPMPSGPRLREVIDLCRALLFPGFYGEATPGTASLAYHIGVDAERLFATLSEQIEAGLCFRRAVTDDLYGTGLRARAADMAARLIGRLPEVRRLLATDVEAAFNGDPAAESYDEIISCYPVIKALTVYRVAHELVRLDVPLVPRILSEMAHSETGIDIHPAATIGSHFTIDHGTGVVIGATCIIGHHVKLYQGVTLGARSFPLDDEGNPIKHIPRHPVLGNHVIVYSNSTVLGRIHIGDGAVIGGNVWLTHDVEPGAVIRQTPCGQEAVKKK